VVPGKKWSCGLAENGDVYQCPALIADSRSSQTSGKLYTPRKQGKVRGKKKENRRMRWLDNLFQHLVVVAVRCALPIFIYRNKLFRRWHCKKVNRRKIAGGGGAVAKVFPIYFDAFVGTRPFVCGDMSKYLMAKYLRTFSGYFWLLNSMGSLGRVADEKCKIENDKQAALVRY